MSLTARITITQDQTRWLYSAIEDAETCATCKAADGQEAVEQNDLTTAPNPNCTNPDGCRCMHIGIQT